MVESGVVRAHCAAATALDLRLDWCKRGNLSGRSELRVKITRERL